jgi:hypothetical protein
MTTMTKAMTISSDGEHCDGFNCNTQTQWID